MLETWLFKYPLETFAQGRVFLAGDGPLWLLLAAVALALGLLLVSIWRLPSHLRPRQRVTIVLLQLAVIALCVVLLWQPSLELYRLRDQVNRVTLLVDGSASMAYRDDDISRQDQAQAVADHPAMARLANRFSMNRLQFSDRVTTLSDEQPAGSDSPATRLFEALDQALAASRSAALGAVVVVSDGIDEQIEWSPLRFAQLADYGVPVHTVTVGRQRIAEDVALAQVMLPQRVLPGSNLRARVDLSHDAAHRAVLTVTSGEEILSVSEHALAVGSDQTSVWVDIALNRPGHQLLEFSVAAVPGETNLHNNRMTKMVEVAEDTLQVLYLEGEPRWEYKFLRRALMADSGIQMRSVLRVSPNRFYRQGIDGPEDLASGFPESLEALSRFHVVIIGSLEAATLEDWQVDALARFVRQRGGGLLMLGGRAGLGEGGWGATALSPVLPVVLPPAGSGGFQRVHSPVLPPGAGTPLPLPRLARDIEAEPSSWMDLPALADFQRVGTLKPGASTLLEMRPGRDALPLLVHQRYGQGQVAVLATGGTWRWQMSLPADDQRHEQFWRQLVRGLASSAEARFTLETRIDGDAVLIRARLRNEDYSPREDHSVTVSVTEGAQAPRQVRLEPTVGDPGGYSARYRPQGDGDDSGAAGRKASRVVHVEASDEPGIAPRTAVAFDAERAEFATLRANRPLLENIARVTGGRHWQPSELDLLPDEVARSSSGIRERQVLALWDAPIAFLLLFGLKAAEWLLRRRWKSV